MVLSIWAFILKKSQEDMWVLQLTWYWRAPVSPCMCVFTPIPLCVCVVVSAPPVCCCTSTAERPRRGGGPTVATPRPAVLGHSAGGRRRGADSALLLALPKPSTASSSGDTITSARPGIVLVLPDAPSCSCRGALFSVAPLSFCALNPTWKMVRLQQAVSEG